ncbi:MAG: M1 family metallopeptidase [Bacteroidetes bacterium]|nr:M1 family metallopeptidase [Bacteroidota bacterium]
MLLGTAIQGWGCGVRSPYFGEGSQLLTNHSYANDGEFLITHMDMRLAVNFVDKTIEGWIEYSLMHAYLRDNRKPGSVPPYHVNPITGNHVLLLDHRDMDILGVYAGGSLDKKTGVLKKGAKGLLYGAGVGDGDTLLYGKPLEIEVPRSQSKIVIHYKTRPSAGALQWLSPAQTYDQTHPFLFSQSQSILARTWIPLQDKPSVRFTYSAQVRVVCGATSVGAAGVRTGAADCIGVSDLVDAPIKPTDFNVVMSAVKLGNPEGDIVTDNKVHRFEQKKPIPSYLMAIAVGSFGYQSLGKNTGVYAEHKLLPKAAWEFADLQKMVDAAGEMFGEYAWGDYNVLVLPPSFPFGGMENPVVTFATPTIIAGDRSLVSLLAHELAHSWSGNLVTNRTWDDFWLNEGFTVYVESRIMEKLYGQNYADMLRVLGKGELDKTLGWMLKEAPEDSHLRLNLGKRDPDEGLTDIAYEKGRFFLMMLEQLYGRTAFDQFLNGHFTKYAFGTVTTDLFLADLKAFHEQQVGASAMESTATSAQGSVVGHTSSPLPAWRDFEPRVLAWIDGPGLPGVQAVGGFPKLESQEFSRVEQQVAKFLLSGEPLHPGSSVPCNASVIDTSGFTTHHWLHMLRQLHTRSDGLPGRLSREEMAGLDARFHFTQTQNAEIACDWFVLSIQSDYRPAYQAMHDFLLRVGRRKFLMPIYEALLAQHVVIDGKYVPAFAQGKEMATEIFLQAEPGYHSVAARSLRELLALALTGGSGR